MKTQRYIAKNSQIVVRNVKPGSTAVRHETKSEMDVTAENLTVEVPCPVTEDSVCRIVRDGFEVFFPAFRVRSRVIVETGDVDANLLNEQLSILDYDVPASGRSRNFSPCARLYQVAVPMTESVWLVRTGDVPWNFINEMLDMGCTVDVTKLDRSETRTKVARALQFLEDKLAEKIAAAEKSMNDARIKLENSEANGVDEAVARETYEKHAAVIEARLRKWQKDVQDGITRFGINGNAFHLSRLGDRATVLRSSMQEQAAAYSRGVVALATINTSDAVAMTPLAQNDQLPVAILADMLRENGHEDDADAIQAAFKEAEEETFSLSGIGSDEVE